jgi:hypothetical protein
MEVLEATMKKHNINIDFSSYYHANALFYYGFSFNETSTSSSNEWLIDSGASYHMAKDKAIFSALNEGNTKKIFVGDDRSLGVVGSRIVQVDYVISIMYYVFQVFPTTFYQCIRSLIQVKVKS